MPMCCNSIFAIYFLSRNLVTINSLFKTNKCEIWDSNSDLTIFQCLCQLNYAWMDNYFLILLSILAVSLKHKKEEAMIMPLYIQQ